MPMLKLIGKIKFYERWNVVFNEATNVIQSDEQR